MQQSSAAAEISSLARLLDLQRPLVGLDVETTGTSYDLDRVVQIGCIKVTPEGEVIEKSTLINPEMRIPPEVTEIHGITDEMVREAPKFRQVARSMADFFHMCDWSGYSLNFDLTMVRNEFKRTDVLCTMEGRMFDPNKVMMEYHRRNLETAIRIYMGNEAAEEFKKGAHNAAWDIHWTMRLGAAMLVKIPELPHTMEAIHVKYFETPEDGYVDVDRKLVWRFNEATMAFGQHNGVPLRAVPRKYLNWMLDGEFSPHVLQMVQDAKEGKFPVREKK